jgi:hypothetical protein
MRCRRPPWLISEVMLNIKSLVFIFLCLAFAVTANAQSTTTTQWSYAGTNYPNQAAALAAMQAAAPQYSVLTMPAGPTGMSAVTTCTTGSTT